MTIRRRVLIVVLAATALPTAAAAPALARSVEGK